MQSIYFNLTHIEFRNKVRSFVVEHVLPYVDRWESDCMMPRLLWKKMGQAGFLKFNDSKDIFYSAIFAEELGRAGSIGFRSAIAVHTYMATQYLSKYGNDICKKKYLYPATLGEKIAALAMTEESGGSDLMNITTCVTEKNNMFFLNGQKNFIVNGMCADFFIVVAKDKKNKSSRDALSIFVVDGNAAGIKRYHTKMLGWHAANVGTIEFHDVPVSPDNLIGKAGAGLFYIMNCLQFERLIAGLMALGGIEHCLAITKQYILARKLFNQTIAQFQAVRHKFADIFAELLSIQQLAYHACWSYAHSSEIPISEISMVKYKATELAVKASTFCLHLCGAQGYEADTPIARIARDTHAATLAAGASELMLDIIAQLILDERDHNFGGSV